MQSLSIHPLTIEVTRDGEHQEKAHCLYEESRHIGGSMTGCISSLCFRVGIRIILFQ